jgi:flagellum-specific ATP synthase
MPDVVSDEHWQAAQTLRALLSVLRDNEDLVRLGAYRRGTDPLLDKALELRDELMTFLRQDRDELAEFERTMEWLTALAAKANECVHA